MVQIVRHHGGDDDSRSAFSSSSWDDKASGTTSSGGLPSAIKLPLSILTMVAAAFAIGVHLGYERGIGADLLELEGVGDARSEAEAGEGGGRSDDGPSFSSAPQRRRRRVVLSTAELLGDFAKARRNVRRTLAAEYGRHTGTIFDTMLSRRIFVSTEESRGRLRRRIMSKIVRAQIMAEDVAAKEAAADGQFGRNSRDSREGEAATRAQFVWATAGDASAAGRGNAPHMHYTSVLHDTVRDAFAALGVDFVARNRALGDDDDATGKPAAATAEMSLCMENVYGDDLDVLAHDFAPSTTDDDAGAAARRAALWSHRAAAHPSRPALVALTSSASPIWSNFAAMDGKGSSVVLMDDAALDGALTPRLPQSANHPPSESTIDSTLPPPLSNFVCGGRREGSMPCDDPNKRFVCEAEGAQPCLAEKFSVQEECADGRAQTSWNRGWKEHLLRGRLLGAYLLDVTHEALLELDELRHPPSPTPRTKEKRGSGTTTEDQEMSYRSILARLSNREEVDAFLFESSPPGYGAWDPDADDALAEITPEALFQRRGVCRTGLASSLPPSFVGDASEGRGPGAVAMDDDTSIAEDDSDGGKELRLEFDPAEESIACRGETSRRGFYQVKEGEGWRYMTFPPALLESSENLLAKTGPTPLDGRMVVVCFTSFSTQEENLQALRGLDSVKLAHGNIAAEVNGAKAIGSKEIDGCHWLEGERHGLKWPLLSGGEKDVGEGDGEHNFRVKLRVDEPGAYIRISSIAVL